MHEIDVMYRDAAQYTACSGEALLQFAAGKNDDVKWIEGDMRTFDLNESSL